MPKSILRPSKPVYIISSASVVGQDEYEGPLGKCFDLHGDKGDKFGKDSFEKAESEMQRLALSAALSKCSMLDRDIDILLAGDLVNQCVVSSHGLLEFDIPYLGLYGACSTSSEGMLLASLLCSSSVSRCAVVTSSHNCTAERQYRFPLEYGGQRPPTAQWTVTGAGAFLLSSAEEDIKEGENCAVIEDVLPGCIMEKGIADANNMGAAMAPATADTLKRYFTESGRGPDSFDMIVTGDLGKEGSGILCDLLSSAGHDISKNQVDCGIIIYDIEGQDKHAGGSGCGCSAVVISSHILSLIKDRTLKEVLFVGTGALQNPMSIQQGNPIPAIAHLVHLRSKNG